MRLHASMQARPSACWRWCTVSELSSHIDSLSVSARGVERPRLSRAVKPACGACTPPTASALRGPCCQHTAHTHKQHHRERESARARASERKAGRERKKRQRHHTHTSSTTLRASTHKNTYAEWAVCGAYVSALPQIRPLPSRRSLLLWRKRMSAHVSACQRMSVHVSA